jgi:hypothetical protein
MLHSSLCPSIKCRLRLPAKRNTPGSKLNWPKPGGSAKAMFRIEDQEPGVPVIRGHAKSKERPFASLCPRSNMSGLSKRLQIGARFRKPSARCNASAVRSSSKLCPIQDAASDSGKKFWVSSSCASAQRVVPNFTREIEHLTFMPLHNSKPRQLPRQITNYSDTTRTNYRQNVS